MKPAQGAEPTSMVADDPAQIIPRATYRLQLRPEFTFEHAKQLLPYLSSLGISHLYLSPIFQARPGSTYGYDVTDHRAINTELGTRTGFIQLAEAARAHGLGIVLDIVPNHMAVMNNDNEWWLDVLENGPAARHAQYFDIDWNPLRESMRNRLLLPLLEKRYGDELTAGRLRLEFDRESGEFRVCYYDHRLPLDPQTYPYIFSGVELKTASALDTQELETILNEFAHLPLRSQTSADDTARRYRDSRLLKRRLTQLVERSHEVSEHITQCVTRINGVEGDAQSFDDLAALLAQQPFRLAYWRVAGDEINYRRFFDVNQLAALRMENAAVFESTHRLILELMQNDWVDGVRIDHIDGLHDPLRYLATLRTQTTAASGHPCYIVVEKILAAHERLRDDWPIDGATGYEFGAQIVAWLTAEKGWSHLDWSYRQFLHRPLDFEPIVYESKKVIMRTTLAAEISVLGMQLDRIAQAHRDTVDFTQFALRDALTEVIAAFPVYRTYISDAGPSGEDKQSVAWAVGAARSRAKGAELSIYTFIEDVLTCNPNVATDAVRRDAILDFTRKFQQVTAPVMAKSVEDTALYRYFRLVSANEVGNDPRAPCLSTTALHHLTAERARRWPHTMLSTSTHDSKRGEDVRYRLCVLSELPKVWRRFVGRMSRLNRSHRVDIDNKMAPSRNDEYLLLQTLVGLWPAAESEHGIKPVYTLEDCTDDRLQQTMQRVKCYMTKAIRESKDRSSWIDPDQSYEMATHDFIDAYIAKPRCLRFLTLLNEFVDPIALFGGMNAVTAMTLKLTTPGVPDFYQGTELNELTLVDPDNRRAVDFECRAQCAERMLTEPHVRSLFADADSTARHWRDGTVKFFVIWRLLNLRKRCVQLFAQGNYEPLQVTGAHAEHICAFARVHVNEVVIVVVSRWHATLTAGEPIVPLGTSFWADTCVAVPFTIACGDLQNALDDSNVRLTECIAKEQLSVSELPVGKLFTFLPVAVLYSAKRIDSE